MLQNYRRPLFSNTFLNLTSRNSFIAIAMKSWVILLFISATMGGKMCNVDVQMLQSRVMMSRALLHYLMNGVNAKLLKFLKKCYPIVSGSIVLRERMTCYLAAGSIEMHLIIILFWSIRK